MAIKLYDHQTEALKNVKNGCILVGGVGSGKSITSIAYYYLQNGGDPKTLVGGPYKEMKNPKDLYIITTAQKRDTCEWSGELSHFLMSPNSDASLYKNKVVVDSWNNIKKYSDVTDAFFIFDEQRVCGSGTWVKAFLNITKHNEWILLSATPGDTWSDYIPVFIANGFYKNKTEFCREHVVYSRFSKFPKIDRYVGTNKLLRLRNQLLVTMDFDRSAERVNNTIYVDYDVKEYKKLMKDRWDTKNNKPIENASALCYELRRVVNSDKSRAKAVLDIFKDHPKLIIFYNFNYELEILRNLDYDGNSSILLDEPVQVKEWNGHNHDKLPNSKSWVYLVQYTAGNAGWNCITTDTIVFYSQNYSYKVMEQASGRIDRLNTPYKKLNYYHIKTHAPIDIAISRAIKDKKRFNESKWIGGH